MPLIETILLIKPFVLEHFDDSGTFVTATDPHELAQLRCVGNSDEMWHDGYVTWLGTIKPGHSKRSSSNSGLA